jgi:hypothetical protein
MFDIGAPAIARLRDAVAARTRAEIDEAVAIADLAAEHEWPADAQIEMIGTRAVRVGADGTCLVDEFLPLEVAALKGISVTAATWLIRDLVNTKVRHPLLWARMCAGDVPTFRACQLAQEAARYDLSLAEARWVDAELAPKLAGLPWRRVLQLARGLIGDVAAAKVAAFHAESRAERFVRVLPTDDAATAYISARVDTGDAVFFEAMVTRIAAVLAEQGDTDPLDARRAKAVGILATPARAHLMLVRASASGQIDAESEEAAGDEPVDGEPLRRPAIDASLFERPGLPPITDPRLLPTANLYVHVAEESLLTGSGVARVEGIGPLAVTMLRFVLGNCRVRLTPVVRPYSKVAVDAYEIPARIREQVALRDSFEVFPYSSRASRKQDFDHTIPYRPGVKNQTRSSNLGPLSRRVHRAKTHGGWRLEQPEPGVFTWTSPHGLRYEVGPLGSRRLEDHPHYRELDAALVHAEGPPLGTVDP